MVPLKKSIAVLFLEIQGGNKHAFDELFTAYHKRLIAFARQYVNDQSTAQEIASGVFVNLWLKRATLNEVKKPEVYLYVAVKNAALNHLRSSKKRNLVIVEDNEETAVATGHHSGKQNELDHKELQAELQLAIAALPEQRRIIFKMVKEDGLKCREVAEILGISTRTVESQLYKAVKFLADRLSIYLGYNPQKSGSGRSISPGTLLNLFITL
ncbi:MAG: RNA polymerase sigma-70 factor [Mucilaginibacter sp.]|uniref:RNA polymerase sigma-70 factor n=1 Tax=Mucilaginibacter sp. TaxID=1882438 RepID=UPI0032653EFB